MVGAIIKLDDIPGTFLYTIRPVDPEVMRSMRLMEENTAEYKALEAGRTSPAGRLRACSISALR